MLTKQKLLKKYYGEAPKVSFREDQEDQPRKSSQSDDSDEERARVRVRSDDQDQPIAKKNTSSERHLKRRIAQALGIKKEEDIDEFYREMNIEGLDKDTLEHLLKNPNIKIEGDLTKPKKKNKKRVRERAPSDEQDNPVPVASGSDIEIPEAARVIYRDRDGTVRAKSKQAELEEQRKQVMDRLADWEKGMKRESSGDEEAQDDYFLRRQVFEDPMRQFEDPKPVKLYACAHPGPANRFDIKPGHRWDGVVRGNGFEAKYLQEANLKKARKEEQQREYMKQL